VANFRVPVLPAGKVGQGKGDATPGRFLMATASGVGTARARTSELGLSRKPDASRQPSSQVNVISNPLCRDSEIRTK
jgi:hypothetical protein